MGIQARLLTLLDMLKTTQEKKDLVKSFERLVNPEEMGKVYQVAAITQSKLTPYPFDAKEI